MLNLSCSNEVIPSLPAITGNGLFDVNVVVPNVDANVQEGTGLFKPTADNPSTSYSYPLMDPAKLIGTPSQPYMNIALSAYVTTLYNNVYHINTNLKNDISPASVDDRTYPTSYAVQQYVQSQVAGTQIINGNNNINIVNTTANNTLIQTAVASAQNFTYVNGENASIISIFWMDVSPDEPRNGASKTVMFSADSYLTDSENNITGNLVFLTAGVNSNGVQSHFIHLGNKYNHYQFVARGDFVDFVQSYNSATSSWDWLVKDALGVFSNTISVCKHNPTTGGYTEVDISRIPNTNAQVPIGLPLE